MSPTYITCKAMIKDACNITAPLFQKNITMIYVPEYSNRLYVRARTIPYTVLFGSRAATRWSCKTETRYKINGGVINKRLT